MVDGAAAGTRDAAAELRTLIEGIERRDVGSFSVVRDRYARLVQGAVRGVLGPVDASEDIEQEVWLTVWLHPPAWDPRLQGGGLIAWLRRVAHNKAVSHIRSAGPKPKAKAANIGWLFESSRGGGLAPSKAIAAGLHLLAGIPLQQIADELCDLPLESLARRLSSECGQVRFESLLARLVVHDGGKTLRDFIPAVADPIRTLSAWVASIESAARNLQASPDEYQSGEPSVEPAADPLPVAVLRESVALVLSETSAPHQELTLVLNKFLELKPAEIRSLAQLPLEQLLEEVFLRCAELNLASISKQKWDSYFEPLRDVMSLPLQEVIADAATVESYRGDKTIMVGRTRLADYGELDISNWAHAAHRRFVKKVHEHVGDMVECTFNGNSPAHHSITFGHTVLLRIAVADFVHCSSRMLRELAAEFAGKYRLRAQLKEGRLQACLRPLQMQLQQRATEGTVGDSSLNTWYTVDASGGKVGELASWREEVRRRVAMELEHREHGLTWAYASGYV